MYHFGVSRDFMYRLLPDYDIGMFTFTACGCSVAVVAQCSSVAITVDNMDQQETLYTLRYLVQLLQTTGLYVYPSNL